MDIQYESVSFQLSLQPPLQCSETTTTLFWATWIVAFPWCISWSMYFVFERWLIKLAKWDPHWFTGWLRPLQQCDLPLSDPSWQRREPFKDSNCGEQTLDALCRASPAGLGTASTLLAPLLPWSIEAFFVGENRQRERRNLKRGFMDLFFLYFNFPTFYRSVFFIDRYHNSIK